MPQKKRGSSKSRSARLDRLLTHLIQGFRQLDASDLTEKDLIKLVQLVQSVERRISAEAKK